MAPRKPPKASDGADPKPPRSARRRTATEQPSPEPDAAPAAEADGWTAARAREFAVALFADLEQLRGQLFAPVVRREAKVVAGGKDQANEVQIVDIELNEPTFGDKRVIIEAISVGAKVVTALISATDGKTATTELDELRRRREQRLEEMRRGQPRRMAGGRRTEPK